MCATYWLGNNIDIEIANLLTELNSNHSYPDVPDGIVMEGDVYPKNKSAVFCRNDEELSLAYAFWGFPRDDNKVVYNSRSDKVATSYFWKTAYLCNRGFIVCSGFYENKKDEYGKNVKYLFTYPTYEPIYIASIQQSRNTLEGSSKQYYSLLTREANPSVSTIHHRMPLILSKDQLMGWVSDNDYANQVLTSSMPTLVYEENVKTIG